MAMRSEPARADGRGQANKREVAAKAARVVLDEGVTNRDARERFRVGETLLARALAKLRRERAAARGGQ